ncbi:MAG: phospholipase D-like domain-containing protein [Beijerinckiaceae bacterium]|nr:phospholipase D-like domain-containing protein [Beijerinckiaceae bacterium]
MTNLLITIAILLASPVPAAQASEPAAAIHYAPAENLEKIDVGLIDDAVNSIDMAAYVLTDYPVIEALTRAAQRGVAIRLYLDKGQREGRPPSRPMQALEATPGVTARVKRGDTYMHLKSYCIDGHTLRSGAANLSASGLKQQDNDLIVLDSPALCQAFEANFRAMWDGWEREGAP